MVSSLDIFLKMKTVTPTETEMNGSTVSLASVGR